MSLAVVVIASEKRLASTFTRTMESVLQEKPDEVICVADFAYPKAPWKHYVVEPMLRNTIDALVKRDVGWIVSRSQAVCYLCDDHVLAPGFVQAFKTYENGFWGILVPSRYCIRDGERVELNVGRDQGYAGGHAAIYRRECGRYLPWATTRHHPNWDVIHSHQLINLGFRLEYAGRDLAIEDIEGGTPWL